MQSVGVDFSQEPPMEYIPEENNCYSYVLNRLGLDFRKGRGGISGPREIFEIVDINKDKNKISKISAIALRDKYTHTFSHMVYMDESGDLFHVPALGESPKKTSMKELRKKYSKKDYELVYLKVKIAPDSQSSN